MLARGGYGWPWLAMVGHGGFCGCRRLSETCTIPSELIENCVRLQLILFFSSLALLDGPC